MKNTKKNLKYMASISLLSLGSCSLEIEEITSETELGSITTSDLTNEDFLDYGLYWFDSNNNSYKGYDEKGNVPIDVSNSLYDASKPTVIYFHGWSTGSSESGYERGTFQFTDSDNSIDVNTVQAWKEKGWNVAIFYWIYLPKFFNKYLVFW